MASFSLFNAVILLEDVPSSGLKRGQFGTVVFEFTEPNIAYEVNFSNGEGCTIAQLSLLPSQISLRNSHTEDLSSAGT